MTDELGGGRSIDSVDALKELIEQRFDGLEQRLDERRESDLAAIVIAKTTADAALEAHNELIKQMRAQATESQRQLDKLTDTYATKENLKTLEQLINQKLTSIDGRLGSIENSAGVVAAQRLTARGVWADLRAVIVTGFAILAGVIGLITYLAQN